MIPGRRSWNVQVGKDSRHIRSRTLSWIAGIGACEGAPSHPIRVAHLLPPTLWRRRRSRRRSRLNITITLLSLHRPAVGVVLRLWVRVRLLKTRWRCWRILTGCFGHWILFGVNVKPIWRRPVGDVIMWEIEGERIVSHRRVFEPLRMRMRWRLNILVPESTRAFAMSRLRPRR